MILTHMTDINGIELIKGQSQTKCREQRECDFIFTSSKCPCYIKVLNRKAVQSTKLR